MGRGKRCVENGRLGGDSMKRKQMAIEDRGRRSRDLLAVRAGHWPQTRRRATGYERRPNPSSIHPSLSSPPLSACIHLSAPMDSTRAVVHQLSHSHSPPQGSGAASQQADPYSRLEPESASQAQIRKLTYTPAWELTSS